MLVQECLRILQNIFNNYFKFIRFNSWEYYEIFSFPSELNICNDIFYRALTEPRESVFNIYKDYIEETKIKICNELDNERVKTCLILMNDFIYSSSDIEDRQKEYMNTIIFRHLIRIK